MVNEVTFCWLVMCAVHCSSGEVSLCSNYLAASRYIIDFREYPGHYIEPDGGWRRPSLQCKKICSCRVASVVCM
jgi:hypothetical protein